jgi:Leucine-rich repeat (LRR) protein
VSLVDSGYKELSMKRITLLTLTSLLVFAHWACAPHTVAERQQAIAEIERLGGRASGRPVATVSFAGNDVTDAGLEHLQGLTELRSLSLLNTQVTDAGLEHLKGLTQLRHLNLSGTEVTDAGLEHLEGLTQLRHLYLRGTQVTDAGVKDLHAVLPDGGIYGR